MLPFDQVLDKIQIVAEVGHHCIVRIMDEEFASSNVFRDDRKSKNFRMDLKAILVQYMKKALDLAQGETSNAVKRIRVLSTSDVERKRPLGEGGSAGPVKRQRIEMRGGHDESVEADNAPFAQVCSSKTKDHP